MTSPRIKLLKFITLFGAEVGGTERHFVNLARTLDRSRFELFLACMRRSTSDTEPGLGPVTEYNIKRLYGPRALTAQLRLAAFIKRHRVQIVHAYGFYPNVFAIPAARLAGAPVVIASIRDLGDMCTPMQRRVQRMSCRLADCILVNAEAVRERLVASGYPRQKIRVIRNGIDLSRFEGVRSGALREELGLPPGAPVVGVVSRVNPLKGLDYFLEAAAVVARRFPDARFLVVGDDPCHQNGGYRAELELLAQRLGLGGRVLFTGLRRDVPAVLSELAVSVLPSLSEGLSNVLLESMAVGAPVVATRVGGAAEAVEDGRSGLLVPPRDSAALAAAIGRVLADPELAAGLGQAARQRVITAFSLDSMTRETERLYVTLLEEKSKSGIRRTDLAVERSTI
jgi:glycosyltransferase involved in cell wall biosynthesis